MQKLWQLLSLKLKLFAIFFGLSAFTVLIVSATLFTQIREDYYNLLRQELTAVASMASTHINGETIKTLTDPAQASSSAYDEIKQQLTAIKATSPNIKYIYTMRATQDPNYLAFIVDADEEDPADIGELYDATSLPAMVEAFTKPSADTQPVTDKWGSTLSGYAPVYDSQSQVVAIVGVDMGTDKIVGQLSNYRNHTIRVALFCLLIAALASLILANNLTKRLEKLNCAIDEIAGGNLNVAIKVDGDDEVAQLASRINLMAAALHGERESMLMATIEGLVSTLEAKDSYTYGHSSEVATIALKICHALKLPESDTFTINFAAILHDIGKIGVPDNILNKQSALTDEEWQYIKQHPAVGAKIIAGIPALNDVAEIVLHHHDRWDGGGYPEPLKGTDIPLGARIIAVADSYQAMTSNRSYRPGMPPDKALAELERCAGSQFDPEIVKAFLKLAKSANDKFKLT